MKHRQVNTAADGHVADVEVTAPGALAVDAGADLALRGDADGADERRDRPRHGIAELHRAVAHRAAWPGVMLENLCRVVFGHFSPAG